MDLARLESFSDVSDLILVCAAEISDWIANSLEFSAERLDFSVARSEFITDSCTDSCLSSSCNVVN